MEKLNVQTQQKSEGYPIYIEDSFKNLAQTLSRVGAYKKIAVVTDDNVAPLYLGEIASILKSFASVCTFSFPSSENSKSADTLFDLIEFYAQNEITRTDLIVALGGGVVGDVVGFSASVYLRGVDYIQIPTTLLAMVDSSVGGKTAINIPRGKNLVGSFYQPKLVFCNTKTLETLPDLEMKNGLGEIVKYVFLSPSALPGLLMPQSKNEKVNLRSPNYTAIIAECLRIKADIVGQDTLDKGKRQLLNLGHTLGHCIEACSNFNITHGCAVVIGMFLISHIGIAEDITSKQAFLMLEKLANSYGLPTQSEFSKNELMPYLAMDKKRKTNDITLVLIKDIGESVLIDFSLEKLGEVLP